MTKPTSVEIRLLASHDEYRACVALQHEIWGPRFDVVPAAVLQVSAHVGALVAGAFAPSGQLVGFVFGLTGVGETGTIVHWSHMLGVRADLRDGGLGRRLKEFQRRELQRAQIAEMIWTYDPLIAKNAYFNLNVLGACVLRFAPDMYGKTDSPLHHGLPTDRFVVACDTSRAPSVKPLTPDDDEMCAPLLSARRHPGDPVVSSGSTRSPRIRIEIPTDFARLLADSPDEARRWHGAVREHFLWALDRGYSVAGIRQDPTTSRSFYLFEVRP